MRTREELLYDPYPANVFTGCFLPESLDKAREQETPREWRYTPGLFDDASNIAECEIIKRDITDSSDVDSRRDSSKPPHVTYTVVWHRHQGPLTISGVPRVAIVFLDHMYSNDQYQRKAFRHEIGLPEEMVPEAWRDLKKI